MNDFWYGLTAWVQGWKCILSHRKLMAVAAIPFLISLVAAVAGFALFAAYYPSLMNGLVMKWLGAIQSPWLALLIKPLIWIGGIVVTLAILYCVYVLHAIIAQPFYSLLADQTLKFKNKSVKHDLRLSAMLRISVIKGLIFLFVGVVLFICSFIPVLNLAAIAGTLLLVAYDCLDYSLESRGLRLRARFAYVAKYPGQWLGLAAGLALTLLVPGLTLLVIPGAVVGGALILKDTQ